MAEVNLFEALLDAAPDAIIAVDRKGTIVLVNAQAEVLFGYDRAELVGQPLEILVPAAFRAAHPDRRDTYFADPIVRPMGAGVELSGQRKDGSEFPAEISLSWIAAEAGPIVCAAVRDATGRQRAEAKFRGLLEAAPDAIVGVNSDGLITLINAQAERLFGYARVELLGQALEILVPDVAKAIHPGRRSEYFQDPRPRPMGVGMQLAGRRKDGSEFPAEISLSALDTEEGRIVSAAIRDATERIEAQAERERLKALAEREHLDAKMHQSQRLESLGQLAGGVAHDFNNLLAVIMSYATFIGEEVAAAATAAHDGRWDAVSRDVEQVQLAAGRATELTRQLLAFGRREVVRPQPLAFDEVVRNLEPLLRRTLGAHIDLVIHSEPDVATVMADRGQMEQVLVNLAVNARDAMPGGGVLTIDTQDVRVEEADASSLGLDVGKHVRLRVSDTGHGMNGEVLDRAFEPFFTTKPSGGGSGLGLATVYGIVTQAGGSVRIYSEPGMGTTFTGMFPASDREPIPSASAVARRLLIGTETILVVEDEDALREVTCRILGRHGHTVLSCISGLAAIELAADPDLEIHLLLTDVVMPGMFGKEVADRVRALRPGLPVLFMSGYAKPMLTSQGTLDPGVILLEKPFTQEGLMVKVREAIDAH
jgi:PAS domain S-box-containing protein